MLKSSVNYLSLQKQASDTDPGLVILDDKGDDNNGDIDTDGLMTNNENSEDLSILQQEKPEVRRTIVGYFGPHTLKSLLRDLRNCSTTPTVF